MGTDSLEIARQRMRYILDDRRLPIKVYQPRDLNPPPPLDRKQSEVAEKASTAVVAASLIATDPSWAKKPPNWAGIPKRRWRLW